MEIDFALLADAAEAVNGKVHLVGGAFDTIYSPNVPVTYPRLSFVLKLLATASEIGETHKIKIMIMDEDGGNVATIDGDLELGKNPTLPKGWKQGVLTVFNFAGLQFKKFGNYSFEVLSDRHHLKSIPLRVAQSVQAQTQ